MAISEYRKIQIAQKHLECVLDEMAARKSKERRKQNRLSYAMHTPPEVMRRLGEREEHPKVKTIGVRINNK